MKIEFTLNGKPVDVDLSPNLRLIDVLREHFGLRSLKEGCGEGECGVCTILMDDRAVTSCIIPLGMVQGRKIETLESIRETHNFKIIRKAFEKTGAVQCGFCTPGMVVATEALMRKRNKPTRKEIIEAISGNLCRCTGYHMIIEGIEEAVQKREGI
ncbi:MAG: (2Fe-2S)-binding protein [Bacteroidales bacterium]|nr:(2Fe-2S)-binding protein [Bacteroidales bacterium]